MASFLRERRNPEPDVPEDVALLHLNDPNWDPPSSSGRSEDGFSMFEKGGQTFSSGFSTRSYENDSDSHRESSFKGTDSRYHLSEADDDYADESPYAEVRASVSNIDDPSMPVNTFRMWFLGIFFTILSSGVNHVMVLRFPNAGLTPLVVQLITYPLGRLMEYLPRTNFRTFGYVWSLNPGPFSIKEHTVITSMSTLVYQDSYTSYLVGVQQVFYGHRLTQAYKILIILSAQLFGFVYAGVARQILVHPPSMLWPGVLVQCALLNTIHRTYGEKEPNHMSRQKFFFVVTLVSFFYYFFPGYIFTGLSMFTWACWIAPENQVVNSLFGYNTGLGMGFVTFDWGMISYISNPLLSPWWAGVNFFAGFVFFMWFLAPIIYFTNTFFAKFLPISAPAVFDNTGSPYRVSKIITNGTFDEAKYKAYSPLYLPSTLALSYGSQFAAASGVVVHAILWHGRDMVRYFRRSIREERDVHSRLMSVYPEIPHSWMLILAVISFGLAVGATHIFPTDFPVWGLVVTMVVTSILIVPIGILRAMTNQVITLNVFTQLIGGYLFPGKPVAVILFKAFSQQTVQESLIIIGDMKLGHYMKIPPRVMLSAQVVATIIGSLVIWGTQEWLFATIPNMCTPLAPAGFTCPTVNAVASASMVWGAIGPQRLFSRGALYFPLVVFFLVGIIAPIPFYLLARKYPTGIWRYINIPVFLSATAVMPPATGINYSSWFMVSAIFEWFMRRFHVRWWMRYNYILASALDTGLVFSSIFIFLCLLLPKGGINFEWWGNTVWQKTFDAMGMPALMPDNPDGTFGPMTWN
ncbi:OPT oligopeptide transporter, partial [Cristinia sonorae]